MQYSEKIEAVETLSGKFSTAPLAILADYRGLTVEKLTDLRRQMRAADGEFLVAKNTLAKLAVKDTSSDVISPLLSGPTGFALGYGDPVAVAKALDSFAKDNEELELKGGVFEGEYLEPAQVKRLASMPGRDELRAKLLALLSTPATQLVRVLNAPGQQLAQVLDARKRQLEEAA